jgi:hypothetical protein
MPGIELQNQQDCRATVVKVFPPAFAGYFGVMKILRLSPQDARTWRENRAVLVDENGDHVRPIELQETRILSELQKKARTTRQPMEHHHKYMTPSGEVTSHLVVSFKDIAPRTTVMVSTIDGREVVEGRDFFRRQVLKVHGECQLRSHTGQFMCAIRDPNVRRPTAKDAQRQAPRPEHCMCRGWGHAHPGRHHSLCEWNAKAPYEEQALPDEATTMVEQKILPDTRPAEKPSILQQQPRARANAAEASADVAANISAAVAAATVPHPDTCVCKDFVMPHTGEKRPDGVHHPLCQHKDAWDASHLPKMFLVNLSTGEVSRRATAEEIKEASGDKGYVTIGETQFGVMPEHEVTGVKAGATAAAE